MSIPSCNRMPGLIQSGPFPCLIGISHGGQANLAGLHRNPSDRSEYPVDKRSQSSESLCGSLG